MPFVGVFSPAQVEAITYTAHLYSAEIDLWPEIGQKGQSDPKLGGHYVKERGHYVKEDTTLKSILC